MARPPTGQVVERVTSNGPTYALRFRAYGRREYVTLGAAPGWTRHRAEQELADTLAAVRLGAWRPRQAAPVPEVETVEPTFHEFASEWLAQREQEGLRPKTVVDLRWALCNHLLPHLSRHRLSEITPREVKRYTQAKLAERNKIEKARADAKAKGLPFAERSLSNSSINHTVKILSQVLECAVDDELIVSNPAVGSRRRLKADAPVRPWVEPEQLPSLLNAATRTGRLLLEVLAGAGLRIGEALALTWGDVDLGSGSLHVRASKTDQGRREVHLTPTLREALTLARADGNPKATDYVIATSTGGKHYPSNLRRDVLAPAVAAANVRLDSLGIAPIGRCTFHGLRRTYASLRCALGDDLRYVSDQLGHTDVRFTLTVYAKATKRRERLTGAHLKEYDKALDWARMGTVAFLTVPESVEAVAP